jgi:hypothetical protein
VPCETVEKESCVDLHHDAVGYRQGENGSRCKCSWLHQAIIADGSNKVMK